MVRGTDSVSLKSRKLPPAVPFTVRGATRYPRLRVLRALNMSARYSRFMRSLNRKRLDSDESTLSSPGARKTFRPAVFPLGRPVPSMKWTVVGSMHGMPVASGFPKPVGHDALMTARVFKGAFGLLI